MIVLLALSPEELDLGINFSELLLSSQPNKLTF